MAPDGTWCPSFELRSSQLEVRLLLLSSVSVRSPNPVCSQASKTFSVRSHTYSHAVEQRKAEAFPCSLLCICSPAQYKLFNSDLFSLWSMEIWVHHLHTGTAKRRWAHLDYWGTELRQKKVIEAAKYPVQTIKYHIARGVHVFGWQPTRAFLA